VKWADVRRRPGEPFVWWLERHQLKIFLAALLLLIILT